MDNINDYYDVNLKYARLLELGIPEKKAQEFKQISSSTKYKDSFKFIRMNLQDRKSLPILFKNEQFDVVCCLAAQARVRYSIENPETYVDSNIVGFLNILECCRNYSIKHLVYASSSSVYGFNDKIPFSKDDRVDKPVSLYAASKKSNELMAHTYSHLFNIPTTGLRFFTAYGPWGRPDMAIFLFTKAISENKPINVFNHGNLERDFTYIDDITEGVTRICLKGTLEREKDLYKIYNIGNNNSIKLGDFISEIEKNIEKKAIKNMLPIKAGDATKTWANVDDLVKDYDYKPNTTLKEGVKSFVDCYKNYN